MNRFIARALCDWHDQAENAYTSFRTQRIHLRLLPKTDGTLTEYFLNHYGAKVLYLVPEGWAVRAEIAHSESVCARNWLDALVVAADPLIDTAVEAVAAVPIPSVVLATPRSKPKHAVSWPVCHAEAARALLKACSDKDLDRRRILKLLAENPERWVQKVRPHHLRAVRQLSVDFPNFHAVIMRLVRHLRLLQQTHEALHLPPLLLHGPPGVGKTEFMRRLAEALGMRFEFYSMAEMTAGFVITGNAKTWHGSSPGLVSKIIAELADGQVPLIGMDELDKAREYGTQPPDRCLLGLLERRTAACFRDECLDLVLDARRVCWIMTCNDLALV